MATGVQRWSKTAGTNSTADSNVNWAEGMAPSAVNDSARAEMASVAKWRDDISGTLTTGGSSTAYTLTTNQLFTADAAGMSGAMLTFTPHATSGLNPTLSVDGLTGRAINQSTGVAVPTGALVLGTPYVVTYIHATTEFILQGAVGVASVNDPLTVTSTDAGAGQGPNLVLYRNSASPAASDNIGGIFLNGQNSTPAAKTYAAIKGQITSPTAASEGANLFLQAIVAGTLTTILQNNGNALLSALQLTLSNATAALSLSGGATGSRNGSPTAGDTRYNTSLNGLEYWNGTAWIVLGQQPTVQVFSSGSAATFTPTAGAVRWRIREIGGGAGGGAVVLNAAAVAGGTTSFQVNSTGTAWTAVGGALGPAGAAAALGGAGGSGGTDGSTGTRIIRVAGGRGGPANNNSASPGGCGGVSPFGGAGAGAFNAAGQAAAATSGSGGGGGQSTASNAGGGGGAGEYLEFWVTGMTTATYTVGAGGAGGTAGTNAGGGGATGVIIVEEFYS